MVSHDHKYWNQECYNIAALKFMLIHWLKWQLYDYCIKLKYKINYYIISKIPYNKVLKISIINSIVHITNMIEYNGYNIQFLTNENKTNL